jgi:hypothetical protein
MLVNIPNISRSNETGRCPMTSFANVVQPSHYVLHFMVMGKRKERPPTLSRDNDLPSAQHEGTLALSPGPSELAEMAHT